MFTIFDLYIGCMKKLDKRILDSQIEVFLEWGRRSNTTSERWREWLELFAIHSIKTDVLDIDQVDIDNFMKIVYDKSNHPISLSEARIAITQLTRYYMARTRNAKLRMIMGRPPHIGQIELAQKYRKMKDEKGNPLSFRDIAKLMGKNISLVHRWVRYPLNKGQE